MKQTVEEAAKQGAEDIISSGRIFISPDLLPVRTGASIAYGIRLKMKCHKLMENTKMNIIRRYHALCMES